MGGAALLPSGGNYGGSTAGMFRFNTTSNHVEFYDGTAWQTSVNRSGDTMTGPLVLNTTTGNNTPSITVNAPTAIQVLNATGGVNSQSLTNYRTSAASYSVGTSDGYVGNVFYINSSAIAGQAGSQIGFSMYPNGVIHLANTNTNLAGGPLVRMGPDVTLNSAGLARLNVESRDVAGTGFICEWYNNSPTAIGSITVSGLGVNYNNTSDYRLKENVSPLANSIDRLKLLKPVHYNYKEHPEAPQDGFIAHEVQSVVPAAVTGNKDEVTEEGVPVYQGLDASKLIPLLTASLQEAVSRIETLEAELAALKGA